MNTHTQTSESNTSEALNRLRNLLDKKLDERQKKDDIIRTQQDANDALATDTAALVVAAVEGRLKGVEIEPIGYGYAVFLNTWQVAAIVAPKPHQNDSRHSTHIKVKKVNRRGGCSDSAESSYAFHGPESAAEQVLKHIMDAPRV